MTGELLVNGETILLNEDGTFSVNGNPNSIEVEYNENKVIVQKNKNGQYIFNAVQDWDTIWDSMDAMEEQHRISTTGESAPLVTIAGFYDTYKEGDKVHCNRFNGPASDNVHYPKSHWKAYTNFVGSDCQLAITFNKSLGPLCALDYTSNTWCNGYGRAAACSAVIGHSRTYHKH